ncbi:MAG TPA: hypothetical protein VF070_19955 [Streptosporangiaceae bacterium]
MLFQRRIGGEHRAIPATIRKPPAALGPSAGVLAAGVLAPGCAPFSVVVCWSPRR